MIGAVGRSLIGCVVPWLALVGCGIPWTDDGQMPARAFTDEIILDTKPIACD